MGPPFRGPKPLWGPLISRAHLEASKALALLRQAAKVRADEANAEQALGLRCAEAECAKGLLVAVPTWKLIGGFFQEHVVFSRGAPGNLQS